MGQYACHWVVPAAMKADTGMDHRKLVSTMFRSAAREAGYHPVGPVDLEWHEITEAEVDMYVSVMHLDRGQAVVECPFSAGDWRVRGLVKVREKQERPE